MSETGVEVFFDPESVAIVGASVRPNSLGRAILENMLKRFRGKIYPVNPKYKDEMGLKWYPSITAIGEPVDLAVIAVRAEIVPRVLEDAGKAGVKGAVVVSGGFAESDEKGRALQEELMKVASKYGIRIVGPNCIGVYNALSGLDTFFLPEDRMKRPHRGPIAIISQSGAFLASVMDWAAQEGIGIAKAINFGNKVDIDEVDLLRYFRRDDHIRVIIAYLEGIKPGKGRLFVEEASKTTRVKPIVLLKSGKTERGAAAAASHTAALAGSYEVFSAAMRQAKVIEAEETIDLFDMAKALSWLNYPRGRRIGVITNAGGPGVIMVDNLIRYGLEVPRFSDDLQAKLKSVFERRVATGNPVDLTGDADDEDFEKAIDIIVKSGEVDLLVIIALMQPPRLTLNLAEIIAEKAWKNRDIPFIVVTIGYKWAQEFSARLENRGIPVYDFPERAARAAYALAFCSECTRGCGSVDTC